MTCRFVPMTMLIALCLAVGACGDDDATRVETGAGAAGSDAFPVTIKHKLGTATIDAAPKRVVALGSTDAEIAFALDVPPVAITEYFPGGPAPWLKRQLSGAKVEMLPAEDPSLETISALRPDLILAGTFYGVEKIYGKLARIAPTVTYRKSPLEDSWQDQTVTVGRALGKEQQARKLVSDLERDIAQIRREHPEFDGRTFSYSFHFAADKVQTINSTKDFAAQIGGDLGLRLTPAVTKLKGDLGAQISLERMRVLDADVLVMAYQSDALRTRLERKGVFKRIPAVRAGSYVPLSLDAVSALRTPGILSIPYGLDELVPALARALG